MTHVPNTKFHVITFLLEMSIILNASIELNIYNIFCFHLLLNWCHRIRHTLAIVCKNVQRSISTKWLWRIVLAHEISFQNNSSNTIFDGLLCLVRKMSFHLGSSTWRWVLGAWYPKHIQSKYTIIRYVWWTIWENFIFWIGVNAVYCKYALCISAFI